MLKAPIFWSRSGRLSQLVGHDIGHLTPVATRGFVGELGVKIPKWNRMWESVGFICVFFGFGIWGKFRKKNYLVNCSKIWQIEMDLKLPGWEKKVQFYSYSML